MKAGVLGSGDVGKTLASGLLKIGYSVKIGTGHKEKLAEWLKTGGKNASIGSFEEAAKFGDIVFVCIKGSEVENVLGKIGKKSFERKIVVDVSNPLKFEKEGEPPISFRAFPDSTGAAVQRLLPESKVVKAFNTVPANYMINPILKEGALDLFIAGNDKDSKIKISEIAKKLGWKGVIDIGGIEHAYLLENMNNTLGKIRIFEQPLDTCIQAFEVIIRS